MGDISFAGGFAEKPELFTSWIAEDVRTFLDADVKIANMEYVLLPDGETWPGGLCLAEPAISLEGLKHAGFNVVALGNNHILDFKREKGMLATMIKLDEAGIKYCGAGMNVEEARKPAIIENRGMKVAVFSRLHDYSFINVKPITATENSPGVALLDPDEITESIQKYKDEGLADIAVLCLHWGMQNLHDHSRVVHELGKKLIANKADLVLGSHSHVLQGLAEFNGRFCFYGQGNFYFYPYPLKGQPNGVLYGPKAVRHRIAAAAKFTFDGENWSPEIITTIQNGNEQVVRLADTTEKNLKRKIRGRWSKFRPLVFHASWRKERIKCYMTSFVKSLKKRSLRGVLWYVNPRNWFKMFYELIKPQSLG